MSEKDEKLFVALDVGTSKTCAIVGRVTDKDIDIMGTGVVASKGIQKGNVNNIESAAACIDEALGMAEVQSSKEIRSVYLSISGTHIKGQNSNGVARVHTPEVSDDDIARVLDSASALNIASDRQFMHVLAQEYILDDRPGIHNPRGMPGVRLEAKVHVISGSISCAQNLIKAVNRCKVSVADIVLAPLAASETILSDDEREVGCVMIDIGSGTTDIAVWSKGALVYTSVLDIAGNHITSDISKGLQTTLTTAETVKIQSGCAMSDAVGSDEIIQFAMANGNEFRKLPREVLAKIIEPRLEELFDMIKQQITDAGYIDQIPGGIILTGGTALMDALPELCEKMFGLPVRRGVPRNIGGMVDNIQNPKFSVAVGLLLHASNPPDLKSYCSEEGRRKGVWDKIKDWFKQIL
ncbi:MAG: cell division protein FtsA [Proteobacteria bacterium]|nr:cell division protein FtsA [Pseudomonadota bacterium]